MKIDEMMEIMELLKAKNIIFMDIEIIDESTAYIKPSKLPSKDEIMGNSILNSINFEENEEES